ncbi:MAG: hypothetical protein L0H93_15110, partial [Nocardioides sp.]|nr:hypothetical protein [Nocardioides sp.]
MTDRRAEIARKDPMVRRVLDAVLDSAVVSLALWTLFYSLGLYTQWSLWPSGWIWLAATFAILAGHVYLAVGRSGPYAPGKCDARELEVESAPSPHGTPRTGSHLDLLPLVAIPFVAIAGLAGLIWT